MDVRPLPPMSTTPPSKDRVPRTQNVHTLVNSRKMGPSTEIMVKEQTHLHKESGKNNLHVSS